MDTPGTNRGPGVDNLRYVPLTLGQSAISIPEHVKMLVFKTYIYNCKYGNRKYCGNSQFNTYSVCSAVPYCNKWQSYECIMKNMYVNCVTIYVNWRRNSDCAIVHSMSSVIDNQYGLESDVIILTSLKRTLQFALSLSVSVLKRFDCIV